MDTLEFLKTILPEEGYKFVGLARDGKSGIGHKAYESLELMASAISSYDNQAGLQVYHACAAYKDASYEIVINGETKKKYRGEPNWFKAKSFWCDIDCGEDKAADGKGYIDKPTAAKTIRVFCRENGFPMPMIVDSGGGVHCYWPLTQSIGPNSWRKIASAFKGVLNSAGLLVDPTRTADLSSILRPAGSHNKKPGREPRQVLVKTQPNPVTPQEFAAAVQAAVSKFNVVVQEPKVRAPEGLNDDLTAHLGPQVDSSAQEVANHCAQVRQMRDTKGNVNYEHWRGVIGLITHCVEGIELAHEWSELRAATGHSNTDVEVRYNSWNASATSCAYFQDCNPTGCNGCPHNGAIRSPIVLGRIVPVPHEEVVEAVDDEGETVETVVPPMPETYEWNNSRMIRFIKDKDGINQPYSFCQNLFYPIQRIRKADNTYAFTIRMHLPDHRIRDFEVDTSALASANDLLKGLSKYELMPTNNKDAAMHLTAYLRDSVFKLMTEQKEVDTLTSFGWRDNMEGFLLGDRLYHPDGSIRRVFIGGGANDHKAAFPEPKGSLDKYSEAVNFIYNREDSQPVQYAYCNTYGSLLTPFGEDSYHGVLMCLVSGKSGKGKTTVSMAARYGLGDAQKMIFAGKSGSTWNARWSIMGTFKNLPVVWDEMTDIEPSTFSELAYTISQGADKSRLTSAGGKVGFAERHTWAQSPDLTANEDLLAKLSQHNANTQAEAMRTFQINLAKYNVPMIEPAADVSRAIDKMRNNMGCAGDLFVKHIVTNREAVQKLFHKIEREFSDELPDSEYRFYRNHATCTLTAARILIDLGIVEFDYESLVAWTISHIRDMVQTVVTGNMTNPADALNRFLRDISNRIIVTTGYRDLRSDARGPEDMLNRIVGTPAGRRVLGSQAKPSSFEAKYIGKLFIAKKELGDWCGKNRLEPKDLIEEARAQGWLVKWNEKFNIGRGTVTTTGACSVYAFDIDAMEGEVEQTGGPNLQQVAPTQDVQVSSAR
jgi:hypothetical protein